MCGSDKRSCKRQALVQCGASNVVQASDATAQGGMCKRQALVQCGACNVVQASDAIAQGGMWSMQCAVCASHKRSIPFFFNTHLSQGSHARCQGVHYTAILWHDQKQGSKTLDGDEFKNKRAQSEFNSDCGSSGSPKYTSTVHPLTIP